MKKMIGALTLCAVAGTSFGQFTSGPDVQVCRLYDLDQKARDGQLNGFSVATTSYNIGTQPLDWFQFPSDNHPFITYNLFRMSERTLEQVGVSWIKHGFFATNTGECETFNLCNQPGGQVLFTDCSDTYGSGLNASLSWLGPRYEVNPWDGDYSYAGSLSQSWRTTGQPPVTAQIDRLMIVHDDDLNPSLNPGMTYYVEGFFVAADDAQHRNSASYRVVGTPVFNPNPGSSQNFWTMSSPVSVDPTVGFVYEEWGGNESVVTSTGFEVKEFIDSDGRADLSSKTFNNGDGTTSFVYVLYNIDLDAQVGSFSVPLPAGVNVTNAKFHAPMHTEPMNATPSAGGVAIDNQPWDIEITDEAITFSTDSNPIRWGTMYTFSFDVDVTEVVEGDIQVGPFKSSARGAGPYTTSNTIPFQEVVVCDADFDGDGDVDLTDFGTFGAAFNSETGDANYDAAADFDGDGDVDLTDFGTFGSSFNRTDCG